MSAYDCLKCCICFEIPPPPWTGCPNGHPICEPCFIKLGDADDDTDIACPLCRADFTDLSRQLAAEQLVASFNLPVIVACFNEGCSEKVLITAASQHAASCVHRRVRCPVRLILFRCDDIDCDGYCSCDVASKVARVKKCCADVAVFPRLPRNLGPLNLAGMRLFEEEALVVALVSNRIEFLSLVAEPVMLSIDCVNEPREYMSSVEMRVDPDEVSTLGLPSTVMCDAATTLKISVKAMKKKKRPFDAAAEPAPSSASSKKRRVSKRA
jgi:hypothetical protein